MAIKVGNASISENGSISGKAGDQTGREVYIRSWSARANGWNTLRFKDPAMAEHAAVAMERACRNDDIGYDQKENSTLWNNIKDKGFDPAKTTKKVETDCARLIRVCVQYACAQTGKNITIPDFYTASLKSKLLSTGLFEELKGEKYSKSDKYLKRGDIQVTFTKGHTWMALENGSLSSEAPVTVKPYELGDRILRNGSEGEDVKQLQTYLIQLGYSVGSYGADGDFGDATELAVTRFQTDNKLTADGEVGSKTLAALDEALKDTVGGKSVRIVGGDCFVRSAPNTGGNKLGVAYEGSEHQYQGLTSTEGWLLISYKNQNGWVSGKYGKLEG